MSIPRDHDLDSMLDIIPADGEVDGAFFAGKSSKIDLRPPDLRGSSADGLLIVEDATDIIPRDVSFRVRRSKRGVVSQALQSQKDSVPEPVQVLAAVEPVNEPQITPITNLASNPIVGDVRSRIADEFQRHIESPDLHMAELESYGARYRDYANRFHARIVDQANARPSRAYDKVIPARKISSIALPAYSEYQSDQAVDSASQVDTEDSIENDQAYHENVSQDALSAVLTSSVSQMPANPHNESQNIWAPSAGTSTRSASRFKPWIASLLMFSVIFAAVLWLTVSRSVEAKRNIVQNGQNAAKNIDTAKAELESMHFKSAAESFALAYDDLDRASHTFGSVGASLLSIFRNAPLVREAYAAQTVVEVGRSLSKSGGYLARALDTISGLKIGAYINPALAGSEQRTLGSVVREFGEILSYAKTDIDRSKLLMASIDIDRLAPEQRTLIERMNTKMPALSGYIDHAVEYAAFFKKLIVEQGSRTYMIVFQNNTELRATGGFIGSYALITVANGNIQKIFVDDVYNPDGQLREKIIPPKPLQHITPTIGMRDINWWPDFPKSGSKIIEYYKKDVNVDVDGVIAMSPDVFTDILKVVGPIPLPQYDRTITADNFLAEVQDEIEYGENRLQPKTILKDMQPLLFNALKNLPKEKWGDIVKLMLTRVEQKHIIGFFKDPDLQSFVLAHRFGGEIKTYAGDYASVVLTNVKGSKTDAFTKTAYTLDVFGGAHQRHELEIMRQHTGGKEKLSFYNRQNPSYVRAYLPSNARLIEVVGNDDPRFKPLLTYDSSFVNDADIANSEKFITHPQPGIDVWHESGKMVVGFWLITDPQKTKTVKLVYDIPESLLDSKEYSLLWQKQPGTEDMALNVRYHMSGDIKFRSADKDVAVKDSIVVFSAPLNQDHELKLDFK